jgi:hypothetical protein
MMRIVPLDNRFNIEGARMTSGDHDASTDF